MKFQKVTRENISLIKFRIQKFVETHQVVSLVSHYPYSKRYNKIVPEVKDDHFSRKIEKSNESFILADDCKIDLDPYFQFADRFIRVTYSRGTCAFIIETDMKIKITPSHIFIRERHFSDNEGFMHTTITPAQGRKQEAMNKANYDHNMAIMYDDTCNEEYNDNLAKGTEL